jgi:hypothetical protein
VELAGHVLEPIFDARPFICLERLAFRIRDAFTQLPSTSIRGRATPTIANRSGK